NVISHSQQHERLLEKARLHETKPEERLLHGTNVWNLLVIDNIDFFEQTFMYGNIYETTRKTAYMTLRMVFQFVLPEPIKHCNPNNDSNSSENNQSLF
ncbi:7896_t:CDS:1, partial [Dentiscutata heterogama]